MNKQYTRPIYRFLAAILSLALLLTFTPLSGVVTLSAGALDDSVTYIGADGTEQTITDYTSVGSYDGTFIRNWRAENYVVRGNVTINVSGKSAVKFQGTVNLILCDGAHLTVNSTSGYAFTGRGKELNIFAQSKGSSKGKLTATGVSGIHCGSLNVYGGEVTFEGTSYGLHLDGNNDSDGLTVNGGDVNNDSDGLTVNGGDVRIVNHTDDKAVIYDESSIGHVTVNGGTLTVSNSGGGKAIEYTNSIAFNDGTANITGNITNFSTLALNGGNVTIEGGLGGSDEDESEKEVILDYQRPTDKYKITNLNKLSDENDYTVKVAENKTVSADGTSYTGTLTAEQRAAISGKDITPFFGTVTVADGIANGTVTASKTSDLIYGDTVTLTVTPKTGYVVESVTAGSVQVTRVDDTHYTFTMPASDVTVSATFTPDSAHFSQDGDTYTIHDATGWDIFCDCLQDNDTYNRFSGKTVELGDNITVSRMAGSSKHDFCGTFEGKNKVLTFTSTESVNGTAPFSYVSETTPTGGTAVSHPVIRNLNVVCDITTSETHASGLVGRMWGELTIANCTVSGTITSSNKYACGFIGEQNGTANIKNCRSSVEINSSVNGDGTHGGLVAVNNKNAKLTIEGCVFDGKIVSTGDDATTSCGGFVGWNAGTLTITDSLYTPTADDNAVADGATFARNWTMPDNTNSYYTRTLGTAQGKQAYTISAGDDVTLGLSGTPTEYNVSGINVYSSGIEYNGNLYAGSGDTVALELNYTGTPAAGYTVKGYTASAGTLSGTTLTMPEDNVTINADFDVESYFDEETGTLTLKGIIINDFIDNSIVLPAGVNKAAVLHINVDSSGATLPQDSSYLFSSFDNVTSIDLTGADTSSVENMYGMFFRCQNLRKLVLSDFNTSSVAEMSSMFYYCKKLATLDLSGFDTSNVYDMASMFESCTGLTTIYVSNEWSTVSADYHDLMFTWCYNLTGGNGTAFDPDYIDKTYIDKDGQPGYLTGVYTLTLPDHMEIVTDADENMKVGSKYLKGAALTFKPKTGYTASNVKANGTELTADDNGVYTVTITDSNVAVTADFTFSDGIGAALAGHSISLEGDIGVNYYTELSDAIANSETAKMHFTIPTGTGTKTQDVSVKDARVDTVGGKTYYIFKCQVAAKEMTSQITAQLIDGEYESDVFPYSVKEYADYLLEHTDENEDYAKAAPLVKAMLNYGANSQLYFDKNTGALANAGLTNEEKALGDAEISIADPVIGVLPEGTTFEGATLSLKSETTLSLYFTSSDDLTFSCDGYDVVPDPKGGYQIARIRGIKAKDIGNIFTLNVNGVTVSYSPLNYCKYVLADDTQNENLQNAVKALYLYWQAAAAYFGAPAPEPAAGIFFTKVTDESEITRGNIGVCTFEEAKAWAIANWDDIKNTESDDVDIVFSDDNDICLISISKMTDITDFMEIDKPDVTGMEIDAIKYYYTYHEEDVYLCGRIFKKVTDESRITEDNIGECTFDEAKAWAIANWVDIMKTDLISVHIVYINGDEICLISISEMTDITDFMEINEPEATGVDIYFIQDLFSNAREDVYLCSPAALP